MKIILHLLILFNSDQDSDYSNDEPVKNDPPNPGPQNTTINQGISQNANQNLYSFLSNNPASSNVNAIYNVQSQILPPSNQSNSQVNTEIGNNDDKKGLGTKKKKNIINASNGNSKKKK